MLLNILQIPGPEFILTQFCPCAIIKMITKVRHIIHGQGDVDDQLKPHSENRTVTILDARKHKPGTFSETGFTLVTLDAVWLMRYCSLSAFKDFFRSQEPRTGGTGARTSIYFKRWWIHIWWKCTRKQRLPPHHIHPISKTIHFRKSSGSTMSSGEEISQETSLCEYQITN